MALGAIFHYYVPIHLTKLFLNCFICTLAFTRDFVRVEYVQSTTLLTDHLWTLFSLQIGGDSVDGLLGMVLWLEKK